MQHQTQGGRLGKEVTPIPYGHHLHYLDMTECQICKEENDKWDGMIAIQGSQQLAVKITKREAFRKYDRRYPYDITGKAVSIDEVFNLGSDPDYQAQMEGDEFVAAFYATLTPKQLETAELSEQGYKPGDIARMKGEKTSNARRYHKHIVKRKLEQYRDEA